MADERKTCAHEECGCVIPPGGGVVRDGKTYCDAGCANGDGCNHPGCNCAEAASSKGKGPPQQATSPANPASPTKPAPKMNPGHRTDHNPAQGSPATRRNPGAAD